MSKTLIVTLGLLLYVLVTSCTKRKTHVRRHLHNWPIIEGQDCPITVENYDEEYVRIRAAELGIRPVDYLHRYNNLRWKPVNKWKNVGFTNNKENE